MFIFSFELSDRKLKAAKAAFNASIDGGITFFDTAEVYGSMVRIHFIWLFYFTEHVYEEPIEFLNNNQYNLFHSAVHGSCKF